MHIKFIYLNANNLKMPLGKQFFIPPQKNLFKTVQVYKKNS